MNCQCGANPHNNYIGYELRGIYDGVLIWKCGACGEFRPRFGDGPRHDAAEEIINKWRTDGKG